MTVASLYFSFFVACVGRSALVSPGLGKRKKKKRKTARLATFFGWPFMQTVSTSHMNKAAWYGPCDWARCPITIVSG